MADIFTKAKRSEVMSKVRGKSNKETEIVLVRLMRTQHITGWRRQVVIKFLVGGVRFRVVPDFVFARQRVAVFVDGCFWHGCRWHGTRPQGNAAFWARKLEGNKARDRRVNRVLRRHGWRVLRIWEHGLREPDRVAEQLRVMMEEG